MINIISIIIIIIISAMKTHFLFYSIIYLLDVEMNLLLYFLDKLAIYLPILIILRRKFLESFDITEQLKRVFT